MPPGVVVVMVVAVAVVAVGVYGVRGRALAKAARSGRRCSASVSTQKAALMYKEKSVWRGRVAEDERGRGARGAEEEG